MGITEAEAGDAAGIAATLTQSPRFKAKLGVRDWSPDRGLSDSLVGGDGKVNFVRFATNGVGTGGRYVNAR
jgi:hypothetical protein